MFDTLAVIDACTIALVHGYTAHNGIDIVDALKVSQMQAQLIDIQLYRRGIDYWFPSDDLEEV